MLLYPPCDSPHLLLYLLQEVLLWANNRARAANTNPRNRLRRGESKVLLNVRSHARPRAAESSLTVNSDVDRRLLAAPKEALEERDGGNAAVTIVQILHFNPVLLKALRGVVLLIEAHDERDVPLLEVLEVVLGVCRGVGRRSTSKMVRTYAGGASRIVRKRNRPKCES